MKELLHKIVSAKPSFQEAWSCYAEIAMIDDPKQTDALKILSNRASVLQKAIRALMADKTWHLEENKCNELCNIAQDLAIIGIRSETTVICTVSKLDFLAILKERQDSLADRVGSF